MTRKYIISALFLLCFPLFTEAQMSSERYGADYIFMGKANSDNGGDISFEKYDFRISFPKKLKKSGSMIFLRLNYSKTNINYDFESLSGNELERFHSIAYTLGFSKVLKKGWFLTAFVSPNISSNFSSSVKLDELRFFGVVLFSKSINKKQNLFLNLGGMYSSSINFPAPIPLAGLLWKPNAKWTIDIGFPQLAINYQVSSSTSLGGNLFVEWEKFTLTNDVVYLGNDTKIDNISLMNMGCGLFLNQKITKMIKLNVNSGYTFSRNYEFKYGDSSVHDFDLGNTFFFKAGLSIGL
jgi:hypothetical protein